MGTIKDINDLTAQLINSAKDKKIIPIITRIQILTNTLQSENTSLQSEKLELERKNLQLEKKIFKLEKEIIDKPKPKITASIKAM